MLALLAPGTVLYFGFLVASVGKRGGGYSAWEGIPEQESSGSETLGWAIVLAPLLILLFEAVLFRVYPWNIPVAIYTIAVLVFLVWRSRRPKPLPTVR